MLIHQALPAFVQIRAGRRRRSREERFLLGGRAIAKIGLFRRSNDLLRAPDDHLPPHRVQFLQPFRDQRNIAGTDLEKAMAAERTSPAALEILRLRFSDRTKKLIRAIEDARIRLIIRFLRHATHNR
jgi:hypothetical protein